MEFFIGFIILGIILILIFSNKKRKKGNQQPHQSTFIPVPSQHDVLPPSPVPEIHPYIRREFLTKNEWFFFKSLKQITAKYNLHILSKVRVADLIQVNKFKTNEYMKYFGKIKSKHIDFVLCNPENLYPLLAIEVDDNSHDKTNRKERDNFIDIAFYNANIPILHTRSTNDLENKICEMLNLNITVNSAL